MCRVDQAGDDDPAVAVHDLGLGCSAAEVWAHVDDAAALDQHIAGVEVANRVIHADDDS
ncbi:hypothetical protein ACVWZR_010408 [Bradyrhizobium sp. i1.3.1]